MRIEKTSTLHEEKTFGLGSISEKLLEIEGEETGASDSFKSRSPGDAIVNARAMSRRKQGNPQHLSLSQRETIRREYHSVSYQPQPTNQRCVHEREYERCFTSNFKKAISLLHLKRWLVVLDSLYASFKVVFYALYTSA